MQYSTFSNRLVIWTKKEKSSELICIIHQLDLVDMYRIFHQNTNECAFYSASYQLLKIIHIQRCKINLCKSKKTKIVPSISSYHNALKLKIAYKQISSKYTNSFRFNNSTLSDKWVNA